MSDRSEKARLYSIVPSAKLNLRMAPGAVTLPTPSPLSRGRLAATAIESRIHNDLKRLDAEQMQVVELVIAAIMRGAR